MLQSNVTNQGNSLCTLLFLAFLKQLALLRYEKHIKLNPNLNLKTKSLTKFANIVGRGRVIEMLLPLYNGENNSIVKQLHHRPIRDFNKTMCCARVLPSSVFIHCLWNASRQTMLKMQRNDCPSKFY